MAGKLQLFNDSNGTINEKLRRMLKTCKFFINGYNNNNNRDKKKSGERAKMLTPEWTKHEEI